MEKQIHEEGLSGERQDSSSNLQDLMLLFPDLNDIAEVYLQCKLCSNTQIICGSQMFSQHMEMEHPNYVRNSIANDPTEDDVVTVIVTSQQDQECGNNDISYVKAMPVKRTQSTDDQDSVSLKRRCESRNSQFNDEQTFNENKQGNDQNNESMPKNDLYNFDKVNQNVSSDVPQKQEHIIELVLENSQLVTDNNSKQDVNIGFSKSMDTDNNLSTNGSINTGNMPMSQNKVNKNTINHITTTNNVLSGISVSDIDKICKNEPVLMKSQTLDDNQIVRSFEMKPTCSESKNEVHIEEANNLIYHVITEGQDGVEESHLVDAIFPENMRDHPTLNYQEMPSGTVIQTHDSHSVVHQHPVMSEDGNTIIVTNINEVPASTISRSTVSSAHIISSLANQVQTHQAINVQTSEGMVQIHQEPSYQSQTVLLPVYEHNMHAQQISQQQASVVKTHQQQTEIEDIDNVEEISSGSTSTYHPFIEDNITAIDVQVSDIPRRGRPPNWMKQVECTATKYDLPFSLSSVPSPGILHKGPLHHKDRVQETLMKCTHNNPQLCQYVVLGEHYHCRACRGVVRKGDLIVHRYVHSTVRLLTDVNIQQVVASGQFCEDLNCGKSGRSFVIHMHCNYCQDILETGHKFHEHLKISHPEIWSRCLIYDECMTDSEQCMLCRGYYGSLEYLKKHMTDRHFAKYRVKEMQASCIICCDQKFHQIEPYRIHTAVNHKTLNSAVFKPQCLTLRCLECGEDIVGKQTLYKHQWALHKGNQDKSTCSLCNTKFSSLQKLQEHTLTKHKKDQFNCADCGKIFQTQALYCHHFSMTHAKKYTYNCEECGLGFFGEFQFLSHRDTKHQENQSNYIEYTCESRCGKKFVHYNSLLKHQTVCLIYATKEYLLKN